jgi:(1->4)-alpha-D-glucan 1-alpha-D-glucosylmutase
VDFDLRCRLLEGMEALLNGTASEARTATSVAEMLANWEDGRIKLFLTATGLRLRRSRAALFLEGDYIPLYADGARKDHVVAFARRHDRQVLIVAAPRLVATLTPRNRPLPLGKETWRDTSLVLPPELGKHDYRNILTRARIALSGGAEGARLPMNEVFSACPVALLLADSEVSE